MTCLVGVAYAEFVIVDANNKVIGPTFLGAAAYFSIPLSG